MLTPEEVVNKRFTITKFREGYDQDEVDDFLDVVVVELRRLVAENEELRVKLNASQSSESVPAPETPVDFPVAAPALNAVEPQDTINSHSLLQLARKLHEEHVREGLSKRDQLIRDGQENASRIVRDAESQARAIISQLELDRKAIENTIDELREFENDYRGRLREYIENQLEVLVREESFEASDAAYEAAVAPALAAVAASSFEAETRVSDYADTRVSEYADTRVSDYADTASSPVVTLEHDDDESDSAEEDTTPSAN